MKKRWRDKTRQSQPACSDRSGEPISPHRSGEGAPSAAAPDREGGDEWRQHCTRRSCLPTSGSSEQTSVGPKRRRKKGKRRLSDPVTLQCAIPGGALAGEESAVVPEQQQQRRASNTSIKISYSNSLADLQEPGKHSSFPPSGKETIKQNNDAILKNVSLDDAELSMDQPRLHASHSSSRSVGAENEDAFDEDGTSSGLKVEKKLNPSSRDPGKIAQYEDEDEDGHSSNKPSSMDLSEMIAQDDDEQHSDKIHAHPIKEHRQDQEWSRGYVLYLLGIENDTLRKMILHSFDQLNYDQPSEDPYSWSEDKQEHFAQLDQRLAFYRIRSHELSLDSELAKLNHEDLAQHYPLPVLHDNGYFEHYQESLEWYIDPQSYLQVGLEDYHRLVLRNNGEYQDWDCYSSTLNSYEKDLAYVQYCEAMENEIKWIEDYLIDSSIPWERVEDVAYLQALNIASRFPSVSRGLVYSGFKEHIWSVEDDFCYYKGVDVVFSEIWKQVTKRKMDFTEAWSEVCREQKFPFLDIELKVKCSLSNTWTMKDKYDACVAGIGDLVPDDEALHLITEAVRKMNRKPKTYVDYARKKLEIAKEIGLIRSGEGLRSLCNADETMVAKQSLT